MLPQCFLHGKDQRKRDAAERGNLTRTKITVHAAPGESLHRWPLRREGNAKGILVMDSYPVRMSYV